MFWACWLGMPRRVRGDRPAVTLGLQVPDYIRRRSRPVADAPWPIRQRVLGRYGAVFDVQYCDSGIGHKSCINEGVPTPSDAAAGHEQASCNLWDDCDDGAYGVVGAADDAISVALSSSLVSHSLYRVPFGCSYYGSCRFGWMRSAAGRARC